MLHFHYWRSDEDEQWKFCGELSGAWVEEMRAVWRRIRQQARHGRATVDLSEVTDIDEAGEQLLAEMQREGADLAGRGLRRKGREAEGASLTLKPEASEQVEVAQAASGSSEGRS